jgi:RsiW-degrading membrane proteinase PrsW (M82 family)
MHMVFGLLMGVELGLAKHSKLAGTGDSGKHTLLAMALPVLWHTVFDASTSNNPALAATDERTQIAGIVFAIVVLVTSIALQFVVLIRFKRDTEKLCGMSVVDDAQPAETQE